MSELPTDIPSSASSPAPPEVVMNQPASGAGGKGDRLTPERFAELFEASSRGMWCIAVAVVRDRDLASDIVQDSAIIALGKLAEFDPATSFHAWMGQIVRYTALNHGRKRARHREVVRRAVHEAPFAAESSGTDDPAGMGLEGFDERVSGALDDLDDVARACLLMKTVVGLGYREISEALGIPEGTAMSHVFRSRKTLRERLASTHGPGTKDHRDSDG
jgi:RNA polymerase sigma-70 factor, ECF subfamily